MYLSKHISEIREVVVDNVTRMVACGSSSMGSRLYKCKNSGCTYTKNFNQTCKSRACSSCGVKSIERWIRQQQHVLPALESLLGKDAQGLSANSICRLKERWYAEYEQWRKRDLGRRRYVYVWADGV
ncbi:transposase zinc-binding domain-containing protein, partial [Vibrio jasicida]|uniref:transposase zinc-binding domain-containing protein n=1 Tax=Vibrio jasicida TaxID=766224 RepID=UPI0040382242